MRKRYIYIYIYDLAEESDFTFIGTRSGDRAGSSGAAPGELTGAGAGDAFLGAPLADNREREDSGSAYLTYMPKPSYRCQGQKAGASGSGEAGAGGSGEAGTSGSGSGRTGGGHGGSRGTGHSSAGGTGSGQTGTQKPRQQASCVEPSPAPPWTR